MFGAFQGIVQYGFDARDPTTLNTTGPHLNLFYTCQLMTDSRITDPIDRLFSVYKLVYKLETGRNDKPSVEGSYKESIQDLQSITLDLSVSIKKVQLIIKNFRVLLKEEVGCG